MTPPSKVFAGSAWCTDVFSLYLEIFLLMARVFEFKFTFTLTLRFIRDFDLEVFRARLPSSFLEWFRPKMCPCPTGCYLSVPR